MSLMYLMRIDRLAMVAAALAWIGLSAAGLSSELQHPGMRGIAVLALLLAGPFLVMNMTRFPVYVLTVYALLVPLNDLLTTSGGPTLTKLLGIIVAGSLALSLVLGKHIVPPSRSLLALVALCWFMGITIFWAIDANTAIGAFTFYLSQAGLLTAIALYPFSKRDLILVMGAVVVGAIVQSVYGDYQFLRGGGLALAAHGYIGTEAHAIDPNAFGADLVAPIAVALTLLMRAGWGIRKLLLVGALAVMLLAFVMSGSRGATFGLMAALAFLAWRSRYRTAFLAVIATSALAIAASPLGQRFAQPDVITGNGRMDIWKVGIASLSQYWLTGAGIGNFTNAFVQFYFAAPHMWLSWDRVAHSIFLQNAVEGGIFGFTLFVVFWYLQFRELANVEPDSDLADICNALRAGVLGLFVTGFGLDLMDYKFTWLLFALVAIARTVLLRESVSGQSGAVSGNIARDQPLPLALLHDVVSRARREPVP